MRYLVLVLAASLLVGCFPADQDPLEAGQKRDPESGRAYRSTLVVTLDNGCTVNEVSIRNKNTVYLTYCPSGTVSTNYQCGKVRCNNTLAVVEPSAEELAKAAALAKLTVEERSLLGLKESK